MNLTINPAISNSRFHKSPNFTGIQESLSKLGKETKTNLLEIGKVAKPTSEDIGKLKDAGKVIFDHTKAVIKTTKGQVQKAAEEISADENFKAASEKVRNTAQKALEKVRNFFNK